MRRASWAAAGLSPEANAAPSRAPLQSDTARLSGLRTRLVEARGEAQAHSARAAELSCALNNAELASRRAEGRMKGQSRRISALEVQLQLLDSTCQEEADLRRRAEAAVGPLQAKLKKTLAAAEVRVAEAEARVADAELRATQAEARADRLQSQALRGGGEQPSDVHLVEQLARLSLQSPVKKGAQPAARAPSQYAGRGAGQVGEPDRPFARPRAPGGRTAQGFGAANKSAS